ncbi:Ubiquitin-conjugating enzyme E2 6 [Dissophora globulifera]|nr:Ubiquitin-conjugating enzyme E2 6 [Dissophora globulifera]
MATKGAYKRLTKEYINIQKSPPAYLFARPLESNILEWHYVLKGPPETPYHGGEYHGKLVFPADYPFKPPSIRMTTPNGRFMVDTRLCLSMSDFHPGTWNPSWSVSTILNGLLSFMSQEESTTGSITTSHYEKTVLALRSHTFNMANPKFRELFPELVAAQQVPFHIAFPNAPMTESPPAPAPAIALPTGMMQRKSASVQPVLAGAGAQSGQGAAATAGAVAGGINNNSHHNNAMAAGAAGAAARRPSLFSMSHWHKWLAFFLVFAYLVIAKSITRATASASSFSESSS